MGYLRDMAHDHPRRPDITTQLARVEGHVRSIKEMTEAGKPYVDVLHQLGAVQAALRKTAQMVVDDHVENCLHDAIERGKGRQALDELKQALQTILR